MKIDLMLGDCLERMKEIPSGSVDMILCDLPYGTTACKWDTVIPFEPLWEQYHRIAKKNAAIVLTASQPFTTALIASNMREFRYCWVWEKSKASNFLHARKQPLKAHEDVAVFSVCSHRYNPQKTAGKPFSGAGRKRAISTESSFNASRNPTWQNDNHGDRFPRSVQYFVTAEADGSYHPTQKPVALMEYMIRTYTQEGETVLDNCMGSGTTGVACVRTGRNFIGIERDEGYFKIAEDRIASERDGLHD